MGSVKSLHVVDLLLGNKCAERLIDQGIHLRAGEKGVGQGSEGFEVEGGELRGFHEPIDDGEIGHTKDSIAWAGGGKTSAHQCVEIVRKQNESWILNATIKAVVISNSVREDGLVVIQQGVQCHVTHPLGDVDDALDIDDVSLSSGAVSQVEHSEE